MSDKEFLQKLSESDLSKIGHRKILNYIRQNIPIPILTTIIKKGTPIFRGRTKEDVKSFNSEFDISYRTDFDNITEYGRTNRPYQSVFYGSIPESKNDYPPLTLLTEILPDFFKDEKTVNNNPCWCEFSKALRFPFAGASLAKRNSFHYTNSNVQINFLSCCKSELHYVKLELAKKGRAYHSLEVL